MPNINWTAVAVVIAVIVPFANSWFQHWLKTRSESQNDAANPALAHPTANTQRGTKWRWFITFVQVLAGIVALSFIQSLWRPINWRSWFLIALSTFLFVSVQLLPWAVRRLSAAPRPEPEPEMLKQFGLLWDGTQNPHCPADKTLLVFRTHMEATTKYGEHDYLYCLTCKQSMPIFDPYFGHLTLHGAQNSIQERLRRGIISD